MPCSQHTVAANTSYAKAEWPENQRRELALPLAKPSKGQREGVYHDVALNNLVDLSSGLILRP